MYYLLMIQNYIKTIYKAFKVETIHSDQHPGMHNFNTEERHA